MRRNIFIGLIMATLFAPSRADAQSGCWVTVADSTQRPADIQLRARVTAAQLRFATQPRSSLGVTGCAQTDTLRVVTRTNLPEPVQPGVTYNDVAVEIEIRTGVQILCSPLLNQLLNGPNAAASAAALTRVCSGRSP